MTEYVEKQEDWMAPNGWGQRLSVQGVRYQTVCSRRQDAPEAYCTYGLECLGECRGTWVQMDVIEDVSPSRENVLFLAERFNTLGLSPLHFRDAVLDSLNGEQGKQADYGVCLRKVSRGEAFLFLPEKAGTNWSILSPF